MANEVETAYVSGLTLYFRLRNNAIQPYNTVGLAFENWNDANVAQYAIAMVEQSTVGFYHGDLPVGLAAGFYKIVILVQIGGSPSLSDTAIGILNISWNGTAIVSLQTVDSDVLTLVGRTDPTTVLADIQTDLDEVQVSVAGNTTALGTLQTAVTDVQTDVDELQIAAAGLATLAAQGTMQTAVTDIQTDLDEVQAALGTTQGIVVDIQTDVDEIQSSVAGEALQSTLLAVQTAVASLSLTVQNISITAVSQTIDLTTEVGEQTNLPLQVDLTIARSTDWILAFRITKPDTTAQDITGWKAIFEVYDDLDDVSSTPLISKTTTTGHGITAPVPTNGIFQVALDDADTEESPPFVRFPMGVDRWYNVTYWTAAGLKIPGEWGKFKVAGWGTSTDTPPA